MQLRKLLCIVLTLWLGAANLALAAKSPRRGTAKRGTSKSFQKKKKTSSRTRKSQARARRSGPPRQEQPTPERYREIQQALADRGYFDGPVDGSWDADSVNALKRFQADQNLAVDGKLGALSLIALGLGPKREPLPPQFDAKPAPMQDPDAEPIQEPEPVQEPEQ